MRRLLLTAVAAITMLLPADLAAATRVYGSGAVVRVHGYGYGHRFQRAGRFYLRDGYACRRHRHRRFYRQGFGPVIIVPRVY